MCSEHVDGVTLHTDGAEDDLGTWTASPAVTGAARWSLAAPGAPWTVRTPLAQLRAGVLYSLYGWTQDNSSSAGDVTFNLWNLTTLKPGQVWYWTGRYPMTVTDEATFRTTACQSERGNG